MGEIDRLSINTVTTRRWPLRDAIAGYAGAGVRGIGLWPQDVHALGVGATREHLKSHGMAVSSYCCGRMFMARERSAILQQRQRNRALVEEAAELGAACLVCVSGGFPDGDADLKGARRQTADELAELLPTARAAGVVLGIEPIHPMRAADVSCITTLAEANALCETLGPGTGVVVDVYHVWWDPNLERELDRAQGRIVDFHLCDWLRAFQDVAVGRGMMGDGVIDIRAIRQAVDRRGYTGWHEVEIVSPVWGERDPVEVTRICVERYRTHC